ncbi:MAG TPA: BatA domain-containing protein, partial [Gemmatimonadaceae bacterium]|nr:BatA domain-containing protein [Gemmatimonadaceae bacterium]
MGFLTPLFLAGLGALAVPVLIHLINRERRVVVAFPSLMFLHKIAYRSIRRQKIRHLLLLLMRCLALALLVAAFARPFIRHEAKPVVSTVGARELVLLIDRSYSMGYASRWNHALDSARAIVRSLGPLDRATIVFFANDPTVATEPTGDQTRLKNVIDKAKLSSEGTRYAPALKLAGQIVGASELPRKIVVLISDFQKFGWAKREEIALPPGVTLTAVDVAGNGATANTEVAGVTTNRTQAGGRDQVTVSARLANLGPAARTVDAKFELGGRVVDARRVTIPAHGATPVSFSPVLVPEAPTRGRVSITPDSLTADDALQFTVAPDEAISVLIIDPLAPRPNQHLYLAGALGIGDHPKFSVTVKRVDEVRPSDLIGKSLVVLNEAPPPSGVAGERLRQLVESGSGLLIAPGEQDVAAWPSEWRSMLPAKVGSIVDRTQDNGGTIGAVDYSNPIFELFSAPRSGTFATAQVLEYRKLTAPGDSGVIARFDDGFPAMVEGTFGSGKVVLWATSLDDYWTDLPKQPVFLPFLHQIGTKIGRYSDALPWFTAGDILDLSRHAELTNGLLTPDAQTAADSNELVLESPSGDQTRLSLTGAAHLATLSERGFYELRGPTTPVG